MDRFLKRRLLMLRLGFLALAAVAAGRLYKLHVVEHESLTARADEQYRRGREDRPRGVIYDRKGRELAISLPVESAYLSPAVFESRGKVKMIARALGEEPSRIRGMAESGKPFVWLKRSLSPRERQALSKLELKGLGFVSEKRRYYPKKTLAAHLLGVVGVDGVGLEGLEYRFDRHLSQGAGPGRESRNDLVLTIDENIQYICEKELYNTCRELGAAGGFVVVLQPRGGDVLALANYPGFNPNRFADYTRQKRRNRALTDAFEPGSTMKVFSAAAALEEGLFTPDSRLWCGEGSITLGEVTIEDTGKYGELSFAQVLQYSSNVGAVKIGLALGDKRLCGYLERFGFGGKTGVEFPGESAGILRTPGYWSAATTGAVAMGQEIGVNALQLAGAMTAVANKGLLVSPRLVRAVLEGEDKRVVKFFPSHKVRRVISAETARVMTEILCRAVAEGTGREAALEYVQVAGKTGTAQKFDIRKGKYSRDKVVASFLGFLPARDPQLVILAVVDEPRRDAWGGKAAAPLFRRIAEQVFSYLKITPNEGGVHLADGRW